MLRTIRLSWELSPRGDFPLCRNAFAFSLYLAARFAGTETHKDFYAQKFLKAFPDSLKEFEGDQWWAPEEKFRTCYRVRTFQRFLEWFDLVEVRSSEDEEDRHQSLVKKSDIMDQIFVLS